MSNQLKILKAVIASEIAIEAIDDIKHTNLYVRGTKQQGNRFVKALLPAAKEYDSIYAEDEQLTNDLTNELDELIKKIAAANVVDVAMLNQIADHYFANKAEWTNNFPLKFTQLNT